jgi:hypothetical protein
LELQHGVHLNQWRSGKQDLVALQFEAVPTNTHSDPTQDRQATASNSIRDLAVCVTDVSTHSPRPPIPTLDPTTTLSTISTPPQQPVLNSPSKMSDKIQSFREPGMCMETGYGRSADPSPRPTQKQLYSSSSGSSNGRKQQNRSKGSYGNSKGTYVHT